MAPNGVHPWQFETFFGWKIRLVGYPARAPSGNLFHVEERSRHNAFFPFEEPNAYTTNATARWSQNHSL